MKLHKKFGNVISILFLAFTFVSTSVPESKNTGIETITAKDVPLLLKPYLESFGVGVKDVPNEVGKLVSKFQNHFAKSSNMKFDMEMLKEDHKIMTAMILDDEDNKEVFLEMVDYLIETDALPNINDAAFDTAVRKTVERFPNKFKLKIISVEDALKYYILLQAYPKVVNAAQMYSISLVKGQMLQFGSILDSILPNYGLERADLDPELLAWGERIYKRAMSKDLKPQEKTLEDLDDLQAFVVKKVLEFSAFVRDPEFIKKTDEGIDKIVEYLRDILTVFPLEDIFSLFDSIGKNPKDKLIMAVLQHKEKLAEIDEFVKNPYPVIENSDDILNWITTNIEKNKNNKYKLVTFSEWFGIPQNDTTEMTEEYFLLKLDEQLKPHGYTVEDISATTRALITKTFHRVNLLAIMEATGIEETNEELESNLKKVGTFLETARETGRNFFRTEEQVLKTIVPWIELGMKSVIAPLLKIAPKEELINMFNIFAKNPQAIYPLTKIRYYKTLNTMKTLKSSKSDGDDPNVSDFLKKIPDYLEKFKGNLDSEGLSGLLNKVKNFAL